MEAPERTLSLRRRSQHNGHNSSSFVRLHPATAKALRKDAAAALRLAYSSAAVTPTHQQRRCEWTIVQEKGDSSQVASGIEFLPLQIRIPGGDEDEGGEAILYASYNGGDISDGEFAVGSRCIFLCLDRPMSESVLLPPLKSRMCGEKITVAFLPRPFRFYSLSCVLFCACLVAHSCQRMLLAVVFLCHRTSHRSSGSLLAVVDYKWLRFPSCFGTRLDTSTGCHQSHGRANCDGRLDTPATSRRLVGGGRLSRTSEFGICTPTLLHFVA